MKLVSRAYSGYLFLFSLLITFIITPLFQQGVFGDGLMYLTVAFNRYKGLGSFWKQHYTNTSMSFFCEQPPLYFETLGGFYKLFGGNEIAEKFFTLLLLLLTLVLSVAVWNKLNNGRRKNISWVPMTLTACVPIFTWAFCNQVIETMVVPLSLLAFYFLLIFLGSPNLNKRLLALAGVVGALEMLLLTKGIQSVFLLAALFISAITVARTNWWKATSKGLLLLLAFAGVSGIIFLTNPDAGFWLKNYFEKRILATFQNTGATAAHHIDIVIRFFSELLPVLGFFILISAWLHVKLNYGWNLQWKNFRANKKAHWLLLIALSASLPLAVTLEQRGFYLSPAFPFAVIGLCLLYGRYLFLLFAKLFAPRERIFSAATAALAIVSLVFFGFTHDQYKRDKGMIQDIQQIKLLVDRGELIGINPSTWNTFSLHSYLNKWNDNSLAVTDTLKYFIQEKSNRERIPAHYKKVGLITQELDLYRRRTMPPR